MTEDRHTTADQPRVLRNGTAGRASTSRSALTNGRKLFISGNGNSAEARRFKDLVHAFADEVGGFSALGPADQQLVKRIAAVSVELEIIESKRGGPERPDPVAFATLINCQRRLLKEWERARSRRPARPKLPDPDANRGVTVADLLRSR